MTSRAVLLLLAFLMAHYLGDFTHLASDRVQEAKARGGPLRFIAGHAAVHALLVGVAALLVVRPGWAVLGAAVGLKFVCHFLIDTGRARLGSRIAGAGNVKRRTFWYVLGADQLAHGAVVVGLAAWLVS